MATRTLEDRLMSKVVWNGDEDECWTWAGAKDPGGYGRFLGANGRTVLAHRGSYELFIGPIPNSLPLDHLCNNPPCINPSHLEPVTQATNVRRSRAGKINNRQSEKTHCPKGHPYIGDNLRIELSGKRRCRTCHRDAERQRRRKG